MAILKALRPKRNKSGRLKISFKSVGFVLVELLIVIGIFGTLFGLALPKLPSAIEAACNSSVNPPRYCQRR